MKVRDMDVDVDMYKKILDLKKHGIKVLIALGGKKDSIGTKYGKLLTDDTIRKTFIDSVMKFFDMYKFDGLDLVLEVSACDIIYICNMMTVIKKNSIFICH